MQKAKKCPASQKLNLTMKKIFLLHIFFIRLFFLLFIVSCTCCDSNKKKSKTNDALSEELMIRSFIDSLNINWNWCVPVENEEKFSKNKKNSNYNIKPISSLQSLNSNLYLVSSSCADGGNFFIIFSARENKIHIVPISRSELYFFSKTSNESIDLYKTIYKYKNEDFAELEFFINSLNTINEKKVSDDMRQFFIYYLSEKYKIDIEYVKKMMQEKSPEHINYINNFELKKLLFDMYNIDKDSSDIYNCIYYDNVRTHVFLVKKVQMMKSLSTCNYKIYYYTF